MKIVFLTRLFQPHVGGVEKHVEKISEALVSKGHEVRVVTTKYKSDLPANEKFKEIKITRFNQPSVKLFGLLVTWYWLWKNRDILISADIVHVHDVFIWYLPFRFLFPRKKVFTTFHGRWGEYPIPAKDVIQKKIGAKLSDGVLSIGEYIPKNYGYKGDLISYGATDIPKSSVFDKGEIFLYVGRLDKDIALNSALPVFSKLGDLEVIFCGDGELRKQCEKVGSVKGWSNPYPYMRRSKYVLASGYLTIIEALARKCVVFVVYNHKLQKDYYELTPFKKYIFIAKDKTELLENIKKAQEKKREVDKMVMDGSKWAKRQTWDKMTKNYLKLWKK